MRTLDALDSLWTAIEAFDGEAADALLDSLLHDLPLADAVTAVVLPFLQEVGDRWEDGRLSVAHEHFATNLVRRRLAGLTPRPTLERRARVGPVVLMACPPGERHDMVLLCFALLMGERGARVRFLGADSPASSIASAARRSRADAVVVAATRDTALVAHAGSLARLGEEHPVYVAGRGADADVAAEAGATLLPDDPVRAAAELVEHLTERVPGRWR